MPMSQLAWLFLGGLATAASLALAIRNRDAWRLRVGGQALAVLLWFVWSINAFSVVQIDQSGTRHVFSNPALGYIGALIALALLADLLAVILELVDDDESVAVS